MTTAIEQASRQFMATAEKLPTLFSLSDDLCQLLAALDTLEESGDEGQAEETRALIALVDQMMVQKVEGYVSVIRSLEAMAETRKCEADRLAARAKTARTNADWLKNRLLVHMQTTGQARLETGLHSIAIRLNNPSVNIVDAAAIPSNFQRTKVEITPDKIGILAAFKKDGEIVPGTEIVRNPRLAIQ